MNSPSKRLIDSRQPHPQAEVLGFPGSRSADSRLKVRSSRRLTDYDSANSTTLLMPTDSNRATAHGRASVLNTWKEIAAYVGRGVRTVQRWERDAGLPVHRPKGKDRSAVIAFPSELEAWLHRTPVRAEAPPSDIDQSAVSRIGPAAVQHLRESARLLRQIQGELNRRRELPHELLSTLQELEAVLTRIIRPRSEAAGQKPPNGSG